MNSRTLIDETLKYLQTNENNSPKYRFEIYNSGLEKYYREQLSNITFGLIPSNIDNNEERVPVAVYTIGDIFDTIGNVTDDVVGTIKALPDTLENIKVSLKQLGFNALDSTIEYIKSAVAPIEVIQDLNEIYRVAKPLVQKIVNIASIRFHFENAALVAQDVLQYLKRLGAQTAKNALTRLWDIFMDTPIFAVYENDNTIDLTKAYSELSDAAKDALDKIARNTAAFGDILTYINSSDNTMYEPKYNNLGIAIPNTIVDVYSDPHTRRIYIASKNDIYSMNEDYTTTNILHTDDTISKIYYYANDIYYITNNGIVKRGQTTIKSGITDIIFAEPLLITDGNKIYTGVGTDVITLVDETLLYSCYDQENDVIYYIGRSGTNNAYTYKIKSIIKDENYNYYSDEVSTLTNVPEGLSYYNGSLYIIYADNSSDIHSLRRVYRTEASSSYSPTDYEYSNYTIQNKKNIVWTDGEYATDGQNIFNFYDNDNKLIYHCKPTSPINCVTKYNYNNENYFVCSGGDRLYVSLIANNGTFKWNDKVFETNYIKNDSEIEIPENMAGCLWFNNGYGDNFIVYSQENVYIVGPDKINQFFEVERPNSPENLFLKKFASFEDWYKKEEEKPEVKISYSSRTEILDDCIITGIREINKKLYASLFSPKYVTPENDHIKSGIYSASIIIDPNTEEPTFVVDYDNPVFSTENKLKIYSFNHYNDGWYYTDGRYLYCPSKKTKTDLGFTVDKTTKEVSDGVLLLSDNKKIYTYKAILNQNNSETHVEISSLVNYKNENLKIASTKNVLMVSNGSYVYNLFADANNKISSELFQICYNQGASDYSMIQSNDAVFIVSENVIKKVPLYSQLVSSNYGCGYYTDTTPNKWYGAAPYYFVSNVLNFGQNVPSQKEVFLLNFKENFKVELEKLLRDIPNAFVAYTQDRLINELKNQGIEIEGDDGQIVNLIINNVASTTANSLGMYVQEKFIEKIGDDSTYNSFANAVYDACRLDKTNNMTKDFYDIFEELYYSVIGDAVIEMNIGREGMANSLIKYYQNHKAEWAESMSSLIDVDTVNPDIYEIPLKSLSMVIPKKTYKFTYDNDGGTYTFDYVSSPEAHYNDDNIVEGYYVKQGYYDQVDEPVDDDLDKYYELINDEYVHTEDEHVDPEKTYYIYVAYGFYYDAEHTELINDVHRDVNTGDYYDASGNLICYYNSSDGKFYRYKLIDYTLTDDERVVTGKTYYVKTGTGLYTYTPTTDTTEVNNKQYFSKSYGLTSDNKVIRGKTYFAKSADEYNYYRLPDNAEYELSSYASFYEKTNYSLTTDTSLVSGKTYYTETFVSAQSPISSTIQYYKPSYVLTKDTQIDNNKTYFEIIDLSSYGTSDIYYEYDPEATGTKYNPSFEQATGAFDPDQDYYTENSGVYSLAYDVSEQAGPYYIISSFNSGSGDYVLKHFDSSTAITYYSEVVNPSLNNLATYYEVVYNKIPTPSSSSNVYMLDYIAVESPNVSDISTYYEKVEKYIQATNINYVYDPNTGNPVSVINDRAYYIRIYTPGTYYIVTSLTGSPKAKGWYEIVYNQVLSGTFTNPKAKGYYERSSSPIGFTEVTPNPGENPKENNWYELSVSYSTIYEDNKLYIDLEPITVTSDFPAEDAAWHNMFYNAVTSAKTEVSDEPDYESAKTKAFELLSQIVYNPMPSWKWQYLITSSVSEYYIPAQGEQYRQIIYDSNMYPIQWNELPDDIDQEAFDYALTALLYAIKQRLAANITLLVDGGKVKCYSCVDAATVIQRMVDRNATIWSNQIRSIRTKVGKATTKDEVVNAFDIMVMPEKSLRMLENILIKQSALYAKYIDMIIEEQVINDNVSEVSL